MIGISTQPSELFLAGDLQDDTGNPSKRVGGWRVWLPWFIFIIAVLARLVPGARTIDDAYITYRYARNIVAGNGFVYNPGERVLGTTTPLYTGLMVLGLTVSGGEDDSFIFISLLINALADGLTCLFLVKLGHRLGSFLAGVGTGLVWAIAPFSVTFAIGGLETSLYVLLLVGMSYSHLTNRHKTTALLAALAFLARPDALILIGPLALDRLIEVFRSSPPTFRRILSPHKIQQPELTNLHSKFLAYLPEALVFLIPMLAWIIFATIYFGSALPHSIAAKSVAYRSEPTAGFIRLLQHYCTPFLGHLTFGSNWVRLGLVMYPFLFLTGSLRVFRRNLHIWPFFIYPWLYFITFSLANPLIFRWYLTPPLPPYMLAILLGSEQVIRSLSQAFSSLHSAAVEKLTSFRNYPSGLITRMLLVFFVILAPTLLSLRDWTLHPDHGLDRPAPRMAWYQLELVYRQAADQLAPEIARRQSEGEQPVLAAGDVGVLGFYSGAKILDTVGLISPVSTHYYPADPDSFATNYTIPPNLILDQMPEYIIILEIYGRKSLLKDPRFWQVYQLRERIVTNIYASDGMLIFERRP